MVIAFALYHLNVRMIFNKFIELVNDGLVGRFLAFKLFLDLEDFIPNIVRCFERRFRRDFGSALKIQSGDG